MKGNESKKLDYMGRILAIGKGADEDGSCGTVHKALGSDSAGRGHRRENELPRTSLEALGEDICHWKRWMHQRICYLEIQEQKGQKRCWFESDLIHIFLMK